MIYIDCPNCGYKVYMGEDGADCLSCGWSSNDTDDEDSIWPLFDDWEDQDDNV